ncbi:MAG: ROK family protein [Candidatus Bathyarchaeota archaeon]
MLIDSSTKDKILQETSGEGVDIVILATTFSIDYLRESVGFVGNNGKIVLFGGTRKADIVSFRGGDLNCHDIRVNNKREELEVAEGKTVEFIGRRKPTVDDFEEAIDLLSSGRVKASRLVSRVVSLDNLPRIMEGYRQGDPILGKVVVDMRLQEHVMLTPDNWDGAITGGIGKEKAVVIGATGDLGSQLTKSLVDEGYEVTVSVRPQSIEKLRDRVGDKVAKVGILKGTVFSVNNLKEMVALNSTIYDMSGLVGLDIEEEDYLEVLAVNGFSKGLITSLIKRANRESKVRVIYPSTQRISLISDREDVKTWVDKAVAEFDLIVDDLLRENNDVGEQVIRFARAFILENPMPPDLNIYELSKLIAESYIARLDNSVNARIAHAYGEGYVLSRTVPRMVDTLARGGRREEKNILIYPIYVDDLNEILIRLARVDEMHLGRYGLSDVTTGDEVTKDEIIKLVGSVTPLKGEVVLTEETPENSHKVVDVQRSQELLSRPFTPFDKDMMGRLIDYVLAQKVDRSHSLDDIVSLQQVSPPNVIVLDVGGTTARVGIYTSEGELLKEVYRFETPSFKTVPGRPVEELQELLLDRIEEYVKILQVEHPEMTLSDLAICFAGTVKEGGVIGKAASLWGGFEDFPLKGRLEERIPGLNFHITNDLVAASWRYGILDRYKDQKKICVLTVSSGVGYKIFDVVNPDISDYHVASLGHIRIDESPDALMCDCGEEGHLAAYISGRAAERRIRIQAIEDLEGFRNSSLFGMARTKIEEISVERRKELLEDRVTKDILDRLTPQTREHVVEILSLQSINYEDLRSIYTTDEVDIACAIILENREFCAAVNTNDLFVLSLLDNMTLLLARELIKIAASGINKFVIMGGFAQAIKGNFEHYLVRHMKAIGLYGKDDEHIEGLLDWAEDDDKHGLVGVGSMVRYSYLQDQQIAIEKIEQTLEFSKVVELKDAIIERLRKNKEQHGERLMQEDVDLLNRAFAASYVAYNILPGEVQLGNDGRWFLYHPLEVAKYLVERLDTTDVKLVAATFLHDVVEHTPLNAEQVEYHFDREILNIVLDLSQESDIQYMNIAQLNKKGFNVERVADLLGIDGIEDAEAATRIARIALKIEHYDRLMYRPLDKRTKLLKVVDNIVNYSSIDRLPLDEVKRREVAELEMFRFFSDAFVMPDGVKQEINYYIDKLLEIPYLGDSARAFVDGQYVEYEEKGNRVDTSGLDLEQLRSRKAYFKIQDGVVEPDRILFEPTAIVFGYPLSEDIVERLKGVQDRISQFFGETISSPFEGCIFYRTNMRKKSHITLVSYGHYSESEDDVDRYLPLEEIRKSGKILEKYPPVTGFFRGLQIMPEGTILAKVYVEDDAAFRIRKELIETFPGIRQFVAPILYVNLGRLLDEDIASEKIAGFNSEFANVKIGKQRFTKARAHNGQELPLWKFNFRDYYDFNKIFSKSKFDMQQLNRIKPSSGWHSL